MVTTIAGRYRLDPVHIGKGGMGEVWGATDSRLDRRVAVKFISFPDGRPDPELTRRFVRESKITAQLEHPGVPVLYDAAKVPDGPFEGRLYAGSVLAKIPAGWGSAPAGASVHRPAEAGGASAIARTRAFAVHWVICWRSAALKSASGAVPEQPFVVTVSGAVLVPNTMYGMPGAKLTPQELMDAFVCTRVTGDTAPL